MHQAQQSTPSSFAGTIHVLEAIAINVSRAWTYAKRSKGRSIPVSFLLVLSELLVLPSMVLFDVWGWFFNRQGHAIILDDFIPMSRIRASESRPTRAGIASEAAMAEYREELINYRHRARAAIRCYALDEVASLTHHMLGRTIQFEEHHDATMIMHRHILESIGLSAMNHRPQDKESNGATRVLSKTFILFQLQALSFCGLLDGYVQATHATGVGIVENDVPYIPFHEKYVESLVS